LFIESANYNLTPINGTFFSTPLRGRKTQKIVSNLLRKALFKKALKKEKRPTVLFGILNHLSEILTTHTVIVNAQSLTWLKIADTEKL